MKIKEMQVSELFFAENNRMCKCPTLRPVNRSGRLHFSRWSLTTFSRATQRMTLSMQTCRLMTQDPNNQRARSLRDSEAVPQQSSPVEFTNQHLALMTNSRPRCCALRNMVRSLCLTSTVSSAGRWAAPSPTRIGNDHADLWRAMNHASIRRLLCGLPGGGLTAWLRAALQSNSPEQMQGRLQKHLIQVTWTLSPGFQSHPVGHTLVEINSVHNRWGSRF